MLEIRRNILSKYCFNVADEYRIKIGGVNKLVPNFGNKSNYVLRYSVFIIRYEVD